MPPSPFRTFFGELRRRHVVRVGLVYVLVALGVIEAADLLFPRLQLPDAAVSLVVGLAIVGLPLALVMAWSLELSPAGVVREGRDESGQADIEPPPVPDPAEGAGAASVAAPALPELPPASDRRLAVLPLSAFHADPDRDYFTDGMTEELISVLSRIRGLDVIARTSVMQYRQTIKPVREIAGELGVGAVLEGSVRRAGERLRITLQLIDAATEGHLWSADWNRRLDDVFEVQADIARQVADALEVTLLASEAERVGRAPTDDLEAYDLYLLGRHQLNLRSDDGVRRSLERFRAAVQRDPGFAPAWSGIADAYVLAMIGYASIPLDEASAGAQEAAERAVSLDPELADGHVSLAYLALNRWELEPARVGFEKAIELSPSHARAYQWYAQYFMYRGEFDAGIPPIERARELDPLSDTILNESGWPHLYGGRPEDGMERSRMVLARNPHHVMAHFNMGNYLESTGSAEEALEHYRRAADLSGRLPFILAFLGRASAGTGDRRAAEAIREELEEQVRSGVPAAAVLGVLCHDLGDLDAALEWLELAVSRKEPVAAAMDTHFLPLPRLRGDPRFGSLLGSLPQPSAAGRRP